VQKLNP